MRKTSRVAGGLALALGLVLGAVSAQAQIPPPDPKGEPMRGTWGYSLSGTLVPPDGAPPVPVAVAGLVSFDPTTRECVLEERMNTGGATVRRIAAICNYGLIPDGRGFFNATFDGDVAEIAFYEFVLVNRKREMRLIRADQAVMEGTGRKQ